MNPEHAQMLYAEGWSKVDVQHYLFEQARHPRSRLHGRGVSPVRPTAFDTLDEVPVVRLS
ncbi:hypothetical protein NKDENANG_02125 [Candidatus Entotheonellaceae bacterium PAL068K]